MTAIPIAFSHVGIYVYDINAMAAFYQRVLGLVVTDRGMLPGRELLFLSGDPSEHHQIVLATGRSGPQDLKLINQISFRVPQLEDLQEMHRRVQREPAATDFRAINHGNAWTQYFRDPEGNRLEFFADTPWYITQPVSIPLDLSQSADDIRRDTEAMCRQHASFESAESWRTRLAAKISEGRARP